MARSPKSAPRSRRKAAKGSLLTYRAKRNFRTTPEPRGGQGRSGDLYVVQKHAARRLHYDFRLALDGTLKSWAVTKGPSLDPADRRLAIHVEDHPTDYARFEGVIPKGQYGDGTVMVWDVGTWRPIGDPRQAYRRGRLQFELHGRKLKGRWNLVRMRSRGRGGRDRDNWLLIKGDDGYARPGRGAGILRRNKSALTDRSLDQIGGGANLAEGRAVAVDRKARRLPKRGATRRLGRAPLPEFIPPQLATLVDRAPNGTEWIHEAKFDGYRVFCRFEKGKCRFLTRRGHDWAAKFRGLAGRIKLAAVAAALDGEIVALDESGLSDFGALQVALSEGRSDTLILYAFDLLYRDGEDLRSRPLMERKARLQELIQASTTPKTALVYSEHFAVPGDRFYRQVCSMSLEGAVSKRADAPYRPGRGMDWVKAKCRQRQEFVIGGLTNRTGVSGRVGALLLGYRADGKLAYAGKIGTGMSDAEQKSLRRVLMRKRIAASPFDAKVPTNRDTTWVRPEVVCEVQFHSWTRSGRIRQGSFEGLRMDKKASDVVREIPAPPIEPVRTRKPGKRRSSTAKEAPRRKGMHASGRDGRSARETPALTHPDKVIFDKQGLTKQDLADYYVSVADLILPHIAGRPLVLVRCPAGVSDKCFYQRHRTAGMSNSIGRVSVRGKKETEEYLFVEDIAGLVELVQFGTLEIHVWGAHADNPAAPDRIVFDIDPDTAVPWREVISAAHETRAHLSELGLRSFANLTGGKGIHVIAPIERGPTWAEVKGFTRAVAEFMAARAPDKYIVTASKAQRKGKIFVDYLRNDQGSTSVAPYSTRARQGAPVAVPVSWRELTPKLAPGKFTTRTLPRRLKALRRDPWKGFFRLRQKLPNRPAQ